MTQPTKPENLSNNIRKRVITASTLQENHQQKSNADLSTKELEAMAILSPENKQLLETAIEQFGLSARSYYRILRVARTIADLANAQSINTTHLSEAISYRR